MKPACAVVLVTVPNRKCARAIARTALEARLAACVSLLPGIESHYWWKDRIESAPEILLILKTTARRLPALERLILEKHPYETPEFLALPVARAAGGYLDWLRASVKTP